MHQVRTRAAIDDGQERSVTLIARWVDEHLGLVNGLVALRELGPEAEPALDAVLGLRELTQARLSWELVEALCAGDGQNLDAVLLEEIPLQRLERARLALWGRPEGGR